MGAAPSRRTLLKVARSKTAYTFPLRDPLPTNPIVYFDIQIGKRMNSVWLGRVFFELRQDVVPHTVDYFVKLVTSHVAGFTIKGCRFHRIFPQICQARQGPLYCQTGPLREVEEVDIMQVPSLINLETCGQLSHDQGTLSMDPASSLFSICGLPLPQLDQHHIVFGQVIGGFEIIQAIQMCGNDDGQPFEEVQIVDCGRLDDNAILENEIADVAPYLANTNRSQLLNASLHATAPIALIFAFVFTAWWLQRPIGRTKRVLKFFKKVAPVHVIPTFKMSAHFNLD